MNTARQLDPATLADYLARHERKTLLRLLTCGSVDDGKSTLIGRLLYDTRLLFEDQLASLRRDARRHGTADGAIDFALLVDGLEAEREQGITLDVAYRFFATDRRTFIVADTPGHEQYTRNMATGASNADLAVILVDARKGLLVQTRRHAFIASLLGIRHAVLAVNKIDLVDDTRAVFERIVRDFQAFARDLDFRTLQPIPLSARFGDNLTRRSETLDWYCGPTLLEYLETVQIDEDLATRPFRMPVQWVNRPTPDFRGFSGTLAAGTVRPGDTLCVADSGRTATVKSVVTFDGEKPQAVAGEAVTLTLDEDIDVSRGDLLAAADDRPEVTDQFAAHVIWMHDDPLLAGRPYLVKLGTREVTGSVTEIKHKIDIESFQRLAAKTVALNDVAFVNLSLQEPVAFDPYTSNRTTGGFVLIDRLSNLTVGAGMIDFGLRRATNIHWQAVDVNREARAAAKGQKPVLLWFTGLSGAGKSAVANCVEKKLYARGRHTYLLDGDNVRHGLNRDLGFTDADRVENIRRVAETARLMVDAGLIVLASFISPFRSERQLARELLGVGEFVEIFVDTPLHIAEERDPKGLYKRARAGQIKNFTGIDSPYEAPTAPDIRLAAGAAGLDEMADEIVHYLDTHGYLG